MFWASDFQRMLNINFVGKHFNYTIHVFGIGGFAFSTHTKYEFLLIMHLHLHFHFTRIWHSNDQKGQSEPMISLPSKSSVMWSQPTEES